MQASSPLEEAPHSISHVNPGKLLSCSGGSSCTWKQILRPSPAPQGVERVATASLRFGPGSWNCVALALRRFQILNLHQVSQANIKIFGEKATAMRDLLQLAQLLTAFPQNRKRCAQNDAIYSPVCLQHPERYRQISRSTI